MNNATKIVFGGELRSINESRTIEGKAISFDTESNYIGFIEVLHRGCITQELIDKSNIVFTYNHKRDQILARRKNGQGNLNIELREDGVYFSFEAPNTTLGNDLLENVRCGNINQCSFAFDYGRNSGSIKKQFRNGIQYIDVYEIGYLSDLSAVVDPAYEDTYIKARSAELAEQEADENEDVKEEEVKEDEKKEEVSDEQVRANTEEEKEETPSTDEVEETQEESKEDNTDDEESSKQDETEETDEQERSNDSDNNKSIKNNNNIINKMEKRFSLVGAINSIANNRGLDEVAQVVNNNGATEMRNAGLSFGGQIQLPVSQLRDNVTVAAEGEDVVATNLFDVLTPLRENNKLVQAGALFMSNLVSDIQVPIMSASNVTWEGETAEAKDGAPSFTNVTLSPKRLTAYVNISKKFLAQDSLDVEAKIRQDILLALNSKLEETILGAEAGSTTIPAGMFNGAEYTTVSGIADIAEVESNVEDENVNIDNCKWIVSRKFKAALRGMSKGENIAESLYTAGEIDGTTAISTGHVPAKKAVYGDFSNVAIGQWGSIDLTVDPYTEAKNGMVVLVVNAYFDAKVLRPNAFAYAEVE